MKRAGAIALLAGLLIGHPAAAADNRAYETGGPLAGLKLPLYPTQHGEPPGFPGCIPALEAAGKTVTDMGHEYREWGPQGQAPERQLYDGSVEHFRAYMFKYMPIRSFFDRQSQVKNFTAPDLPGAGASQVEEYAEPVYWAPRHDDPRPTGRRNKPVPVVRMKTGTPVLRLDLGELDQGIYAVRVIGAVETARVRPFREPLYMRMTIDDGPKGGTSTYRRRLGYCDEFYGVAEFYFHVPGRKHYHAELAVDRGSAVDLLVHNVSLDDVLAGVERRPIKTRTAGQSAAPVARAALENRSSRGHKPQPPRSRDERLARDAALWNAFPPINAQGSTISPEHAGYGSIQGVRAGSDELSGKEIEEQHGPWVPLETARGFKLPAGTRPEEVFLVNPKLNLVYSFDDLHRGRPLPDPYPLKDDGAGLFFPDAKDPATGAAWTPVGLRVWQLHRDHYNGIGAALRRYKEGGQYDDAHDAALALVRWAYDFPTLDFSEYHTSSVHDPGPFGRDYACRRRVVTAEFLPHYMMYVHPVMDWYDELFDFIRTDRLLAESVGRHVPWVKTPEDVVRLIDVYLAQTTAKRILRYHYHTDPMDIANLATVLGDRGLTDPWMEWLFSRTFIYPLPPAGIQDAMITGTNREGTEFIGSTYYAQGEGASRVAAALDRYLAGGGNPKYDLSDRRRYPKPAAHAAWRIENVVAGQDFLRVGDVCGPDKTPGHTLRDLDFAGPGWRWTGDPRYAFILKHFLGRSGESDAEWRRIGEAAARQPRAPWLELRSRVMPNWAGVLESGVEHDDWRFRRAAYLRLGYGIGHEHYDTLDLQVVAHGLPMTIDAGQRPGYSVPGDRTTRLHNVVQVDGHKAYRHSWATALADCDGARYLAAECVPPQGMTVFRRQIALLDVDEGKGSRRLTPEEQKPFAALPQGAQPGNSYVFDVVRAGGGNVHAYCFHGPLNDDFQWNAVNPGPAPPGSDEAAYLERFSLMPEASLAADAPPALEATWRMALDVAGPGAGEREMLGASFDPAGPRKYTRLHLLGTQGARALRSELVCKQWGYHFTNLAVERRSKEAPLDVAHVALVEPYAGEPFVAAGRELAVTGNEQDARRAVAVEVRLPDERTDVCFADGRPEKVRKIDEAKLEVAGEFAFYSTDGRGLRQATLVGGTRLDSPRVRLSPEAAERRGRVTRVDYLDQKVWLDKAWPARRTPCVFEIGVPGHMTTYTAAAVEPGQEGSALSLTQGADYFRSAVAEVDPKERTVACTLRPLAEYIDHNRAGWVASDDGAKTFWRATYMGAGRFRLDGPAVARESFGPDGILRLWEYGAGDEVRQSTSVSIRRVDDNTFDLATDVAVAVSLRAKQIAISAGGMPLEVRAEPDSEGFHRARLAPRDGVYRIKTM